MVYGSIYTQKVELDWNWQIDNAIFASTHFQLHNFTD